MTPKPERTAGPWTSEAIKRAADLLLSLAQNDHIIDGHYLPRGAEILEHVTDLECALKEHDSLTAENEKLREALEALLHVVDPPVPAKLRDRTQTLESYFREPVAKARAALASGDGVTR